MRQFILSILLCLMSVVAFAQTKVFNTNTGSNTSTTDTYYNSTVTVSGKAYYRIPALAVTSDGKIIAVADRRWGGNGDLGNHRIDIVAKDGTINPDGTVTWSSNISDIKNGHASISMSDNSGYTMSPTTSGSTGYGDPSIVADVDGQGLYIMTVSGANGYGNGEQYQTSFSHTNTFNATGWTEANQTISNSTGLFYASGRILQSRIVKTGSYYRLYAAVLKHPATNYVYYSDNFGSTWTLLGTGAAISDTGDEAKVEELSDGTIVISSRASNKTGTRYYNKYTFTNLNAATGSWGSQTSKQLNNTTNACNTDFLRVRCLKNGAPAEILIQTQPSGSRTNLTAYYADVTGATSDINLGSLTWNTGKQISSTGSCYASMAIMPNGKIGMLWEDQSDNSSSDVYDLMFNTFTVKELTNNVYSDIVDLAPNTISYSSVAGTIDYTNHKFTFNNVPATSFNAFALGSQLILSYTGDCKDIKVTLKNLSTGSATQKTCTAEIQYGSYKQDFEVELNKAPEVDYSFTITSATYDGISGNVDNTNQTISFGPLTDAQFDAFTSTDRATYTLSANNASLTHTETPFYTSAHSKKFELIATNYSYSATYTVIVSKENATGADEYANGTYLWNGTTTSWTETNNWKVFNNGTWETATQCPNNTTNVVIPADATIYPVLTSGNSCKDIYLEYGARIGNQHLLTYENAYVDHTIKPNRYVRVTPMLRNNYSGDWYTQYQTLNTTAWTDHFSAAEYVGEVGGIGSGKINRLTAATYESHFSEFNRMANDYNTYDYERFISGWADPTNVYNHNYKPTDGFDIWIDDDDHETVTFHFPSSNQEYQYYNDRGNLANRQNDVIPARGNGKFAIDKENVSAVTKNGQTSYYWDINTTREGGDNPMFCKGNPSMAYLNVSKFLEYNAKNQNTAPFIYLHNEVYNEYVTHGTETILYYNVNNGSLHQVNASYTGDADADGTLPSTSGSYVSSNDKRNYVAPGEAFRIMNGGAEVVCNEPMLIGTYQSATFTFAGVPMKKSNTTYTTAGNTESARSRTFNFSISSTDKPNVVRIDNFVGKGTVFATIGEANGQKTLTIANGSACSFTDKNNWEPNKTNGQNVTLLLYGCNGTASFAGTYLSYNTTGYSTSYANNLGSDIVLNYSISSSGSVTITSTNAFALYSANLATNQASATGIIYRGPTSNTQPMTTSNANEECEAWFVYSSISGTNSQNLNAEASFIYPNIEGTYKGYLTQMQNRASAAALPSGISVPTNSTSSTTYTGITISRIAGNYDHLVIMGLYPGQTNGVIGKITATSNSGCTITIPSGQFVKASDNRDDSYCLYGLGWQAVRDANLVLQYTATSGTIILTSPTNAADFGSTNKRVQLSHVNATISNGSDGLVLGGPNGGNVFTLTQTAKSSSTSSEIKVSTNYTSMALRFTPDMFDANPNISASAPERRQSDNGLSDMVTIEATKGNIVVSSLIGKSENAYNGYSYKEDALLLDVVNAELCLATISGSQLVAVNNVATLDTIPLYLSTTATLTFSNIRALGEHVGLYDALEQTTTEVVEGENYTLTINNGEEAGRYFVVSIPSELPGEETAIENLSTWKAVAYSPARGSLRVNAGVEVHIEVFNAIGQMIGNVDNQTASFDGLQTGTYVVSAQKGNEVQTVKVIVY